MATIAQAADAIGANKGEQFSSFDVDAFEVPGGRDELWRFTPLRRLRGLHDKARANLRNLFLPKVHLLFGDGMLGFPTGAPYAGIIAAAGGEAIPAAWIEQLAMGGRLVAPVAGSDGAGQQVLMVVDKTPQGLRQTVLEAVHFVPLKSGFA